MTADFGWMVTASTRNIGDDMQCLAARQFVGNVASQRWVDRESLNAYQGKPLRMVLNGWYMHNPSHWPPSENIDALLTSVHISNTKQPTGQVPAKAMLSNGGMRYLRAHSPVGCRDLFTYRLLSRAGVACYFSGCLTLTMRRDFGNRGNYVCLVDPDERLEDFVRSQTRRDVVVVRPERQDWPHDYAQRLAVVEGVLETYARAHVLITRRLHGALPSLAMGTPVVLLEGRFGDERYEGLSCFLNRARHEDFCSGRYPFDFEHPPCNPEEFTVLRDNLSLVAEAFADGALDEVDFERVHAENMAAHARARERSASFNRSNGLESIALRDAKTHLRFAFRSIENVLSD